MPSLVVRKVIDRGVPKLERVQVICPSCGQQVEAVAKDGRVKGYCAAAKQYVDFLIETELERKKIWQKGSLSRSSDLWSYMSKDDGAPCALYSHWLVRQRGLVP